MCYFILLLLIHNAKNDHGGKLFSLLMIVYEIVKTKCIENKEKFYKVFGSCVCIYILPQNKVLIKNIDFQRDLVPFRFRSCSNILSKLDLAVNFCIGSVWQLN